MDHPARKMQRLIVLMLLIGQAPTAQASPEALENEKPFLLGVGFGGSFSGYREETDAPLNRYLNAFTFTINCNAEKGNFLHSLNIGFFRGKNEAVESYPLDKRELEPDWMERFFEYYRMEDTYTRINLEYALDYRLWGNRMFPGYLGGAFRGDSYIIEKLDNLLYLNVTLIASLGLHASQKWIINPENILVLSANFPVLGYALRPHYLGAFAWPMATGIVSLHNYWAVFGDLKYIHKFTSLISAYSDIGFELSLVNFPKPRRDAILRLIIGIAIVL
jgi:hypothetical protein